MIKNSKFFGICLPLLLTLATSPQILCSVSKNISVLNYLGSIWDDKIIKQKLSYLSDITLTYICENKSN